ITATLWNAEMVRGMSRRGDQRWCSLVVTAGLAAALILTASVYATLAEWNVAAISVSIAATGYALARGSDLAMVLAYLLMATTTVLVTSVRFYTYEDHPTWAYMIAILLPSIVAAFVFLVRSQATGIRIGVAAATSIALIACVAIVFLG
ncbi:MAG: hypothetical protein AAGA03_02945, partial [Planctomycetota bacterium]